MRVGVAPSLMNQPGGRPARKRAVWKVLSLPPRHGAAGGKKVAVPTGASALAAGNDAVWVTSVTTDVVTRINGHTNVLVETIKVGRGPVAIAFGEGSIWTLNGGDGTVTRIFGQYFKPHLAQAMTPF